jgi:hypothetical protein
MENLQDLIGILWTRLTDKPAQKYPVLVGVPLLLLPVFNMAGIIYFFAHAY